MIIYNFLFRELSDTTREVLLTLTKTSRDLTEEEVKSVRSALDLIQNIRALREERRVVAKEARSTRRGVLMAQLQAAAKVIITIIRKSQMKVLQVSIY